MSNWYYFFLTCLVEFTSESIWAWSFLCGKFFNYKFNFFIWYRSIQVMYFLVSELWHFSSFDTGLSCFQADVNWPTQREYFSKQSQDHSYLSCPTGLIGCDADQGMCSHRVREGVTPTPGRQWDPELWPLVPLILKPTHWPGSWPPYQSLNLKSFTL